MKPGVLIDGKQSQPANLFLHVALPLLEVPAQLFDSQDCAAPQVKQVFSSMGRIRSQQMRWCR